MKKFIDYISESLIKKDTKLNVEEYYILIPYNNMYYNLVEDVDYNEFQVKTFSIGITCYFLTKNQLNKVYNKYPTKSSSYAIFELPDNIDNKTDINELKKEFKNSLSSMIEYTYGGAKKLKEIPLNKIINNKLLKESLIKKDSKINEYYILVPYDEACKTLKKIPEYKNSKFTTPIGLICFILTKNQIEKIFNSLYFNEDLYRIFEIPEYLISKIDFNDKNDFRDEISPMLEYAAGLNHTKPNYELTEISFDNITEALISKNTKINTSIIKYYILVPYNSI